MPLTAVNGAALGVMILTVIAAIGAVVRDRRRVRRALGALMTDALMSDGTVADGTVAHRPGGTGHPATIDALAGAVAQQIRLAAEQAQQTHEMLGRLSETLSAVPEGVVVCDERGTIRYRNQVAQDFASARHGEALAELKVIELLQEALHSGPAEENLELYGPPRRALLLRALPLSDGPRAVGAVAIIEDVSERRRLEAVRRDFVANVSHELKSPVGALGILAETMQAENEPAVSRRLAERMQLEAFRVARIIDDLLDLSRIESEEAPTREPVAVSLVVAQAVERIRPVAEHRQVVIDVNEAPRRMSIVGDRRQLVSAIHNLLENAVKYSDDGSTVEVRVRALAKADLTLVDISVRDYGIGIPSRDLERIFERFYRVDRARARDTGGTGLGLAIARWAVEASGGRIELESVAGHGALFRVILPRS